MAPKVKKNLNWEKIFENFALSTKLETKSTQKWLKNENNEQIMPQAIKFTAITKRSNIGFKKETWRDFFFFNLL